MGQLVWPPYEDFRDNTERWQKFEKVLKWQGRIMLFVPVTVGLFVAAAVLWALAFGGRG